MARRPIVLRELEGPFELTKAQEVALTEFEVPPAIDGIMQKLDLIQKLVETFMASWQDLKDAVQRNTNANQSIQMALQGVSQQLKEAQASQDPNAIQDVINQLDQNTQGLAQAAVANTPAATQPGGAAQPTPPTPPEPQRP